VVLSGFYLATVVAGFVVEALFGWLGLVPATRHARVVDISVQWNYTTILNIVFLCMAAALIFRFARTGGMGMLRSMRDYSPNAPATSGHPRPATS
jgi:hypothetical protein